MEEEKIQRLETELVEQINMLRTERMDVSFGELLSMYENEEIIINPAFQRYFRWSDEQKTRFIESLLLGIPIPPIFVAANNEGVWELVDGLQRISTYLSFVGVLRTEPTARNQNNWELLAGDRVESLEGFTYETLPQKFRLALKRSVCRVEILNWNSNYDMRYELFNRLNTGGTPLTPQEIRNCLFREISPRFNDFLKELASTDIFKESLNLTVEQNEQLYNEELVLRFLALQGGENSISTSIAQHMTKFMENALRSEIFDYDHYRDVFISVFEVLRPLGPSIYRNAGGVFATSLYDVITYGISLNIPKYRAMAAEEIKSIIDNRVRQDENFIRFSRRGGNNQKQRIVNRLKVAKAIFGNE